MVNFKARTNRADTVCQQLAHMSFEKCASFWRIAGQLLVSCDTDRLESYSLLSGAQACSRPDESDFLFSVPYAWQTRYYCHQIASLWNHCLKWVKKMRRWWQRAILNLLMLEVQLNIFKNSVPGNPSSPRHGASSGWGWSRRPPDMVGCKYSE
jgi:hypothetical protein